MLIDCDRCSVRGPQACGDCVVTVLLGSGPEGVVIDDVERRALDALAGAGLVPPLRLRLVEPVPPDRGQGLARDERRRQA